MSPIRNLLPQDIAAMARAQFNGGFSARSDALTALNLIEALALRVKELEQFGEFNPEGEDQ